MPVYCAILSALDLHSHKKQLYIFISVSFELSFVSWIVGSNDDIQWSGVFPLRVMITDTKTNTSNW